MFAGLVSPRRETKVRGYCARTFEPIGGIDRGFECQSSDRAYKRRLNLLDFRQITLTQITHKPRPVTQTAEIHVDLGS